MTDSWVTHQCHNRAVHDYLLSLALRSSLLQVHEVIGPRSHDNTGDCKDEVKGVMETREGDGHIVAVHDGDPYFLSVFHGDHDFADELEEAYLPGAVAQVLDDGDGQKDVGEPEDGSYDDLNEHKVHLTDVAQTFQGVAQ